ncbi:hypothetical protein CCP2SC5_30015 [Azospirillaceae bacterium]
MTHIIPSSAIDVNAIKMPLQNYLKVLTQCQALVDYLLADQRKTIIAVQQTFETMTKAAS